MKSMESKMAAAVATPTTVAPPAPEPGFTCQCGRRFRQKAPYARHMDVAHSSCASIKCSVCGKTFGTHNTLTMHMSVHDVKQQPFVRLQHVTDMKKAVTEVISGGVISGGVLSGAVAVANSCDGVKLSNSAAAPIVNGTTAAADETKRAITGDVRSEHSPESDDAIAVRKSSRLRGKVPAWKAMLEDSAQSLDAADDGDGDAPASKKRKSNRKSDDDNEDDDDVEPNRVARETSVAAAPRDPGVAVVAPTPRAPPPLTTTTSSSSSSAKRSRTGKRTTEPAAFVCPTCAKEFTSDKYLTMHRALHEVVNPAENLMSDVYRQPDTSEAPQSSPRVRSPGGGIGTGGGGAGGGGGGGANTSWTCKICRKTFAQNSNFKNHMRTHSDERPFVCSICSIGFKERYHLKKHQLFKHSTELREECRVCGKRFKDSTAVRAHERIHSDVRPYVCRRCGKAFKTSECLWHHENRSKTCGVALDEHVQRIRQQLQEQQQQQQQKHLQQQQQQQQQLQQKPQLAVYGSCVKTEAYVKADPPRDLSDKAAAPVQRPRLPLLVAVPATMSPQAPPSGKPAAYLIVKKEPAPSELQQACAFLQTVTTATKTEQEPETKSVAQASTRQSRFSCERCVKQFSTATAYERHLLKHSETRPYRCDACDVGFKLKVHLKKHHLYRHTDEYPCGCSICGKRFKDSSAVRLHERIHSTERPFRCGCGKTFKTRENLWGHQHRIQCDALAGGSGSRADAAACACCMPGATASPTRASDDDGVAPAPDGGGQTARGQQQGHVTVSAHASACSSRVVAQAYCAEKRVTAHAMIGHNGEVTAHVTIAPNPGGGNGSEVRLTNGYGDVTETPPAPPPRINGHVTDAEQSTLPSFASFATPTPISSNANTTSIAQQCPTIQSFLLRGPDYSERTKLPGIQQIFQNHRTTPATVTPPSQSPSPSRSPRPPPSYSSYARSLQPSRNVVVLPNAAPDDLYTSVHERLAKTSLPLYDKLRCDAYSDCGAGDLSDINDPCLTDCIIGAGIGVGVGGGRSGIPVIYWDDEAERKSMLASPWHKDTDSLFHDISDGTFSHL